MGSQGKEDRITLLNGAKKDANVYVRFAEDNLTAWGDFYPATGDGAPLDYSAVASALTRYKIVYGLVRENIENAITQCNRSGSIVQDIPVARGNPPVREVLEYFELNPAIQNAPREPKGNARVDYRTYSPFIIVKKGQILALKKAKREGRDGVDINGNAVPFGSVKPDGVSGGENTRSDEKYIYADINGQLVQEKGVLRVQDFLVIKGAVDYHTGNLVFPGNITIEGPVCDGFKIYSGGSVTIKQTFDVTDAITKADLSVAGGIIGRGQALVKVGGTLKAKFIENCKVAVRKTIFVETDIVNASVYTMEQIEMGEKGKILGGEIYAVRGIKAGVIGKKSGRNTTIHCGVDFTALQEKEKLNHTLRMINAKLTRVREILAAESAECPEPEEGTPAAERRGKITEALTHLEEEQKKTSAAISAILARLNVSEDAVVEILGEIAPGTLIEICQIALFVSEPLRHVRVRLDRVHGRLVSETIPK
jgi:uncharacterized protein (DUF342 family)